MAWLAAEVPLRERRRDTCEAVATLRARIFRQFDAGAARASNARVGGARVGGGMQRLALAVLLCLSGCRTGRFAALGDPGIRPFDFHMRDFRLPSGLRIVVQEDLQRND